MQMRFAALGQKLKLITIDLDIAFQTAVDKIRQCTSTCFQPRIPKTIHYQISDKKS